MASVEEILGQCKDSEYPIELLQKLHTRQLINLLRKGDYYPYCSCGYRSCDYDVHISKERASIANIKQVLATREHVPSRAESKRARIERIKRGR